MLQRVKPYTAPLFASPPSSKVQVGFEPRLGLKWVVGGRAAGGVGFGLEGVTS